MGLKEREYMRRKFFDEEHPWVETSPSSPKTTAESASGTQQRAKGGRFTVEVTHEEYVRIYGKEPFADTNIIKVEVSRTEYERIYRNNPVLASQRRWQGKSSQRSKGKWTKLRNLHTCYRLSSSNWCDDLLSSLILNSAKDYKMMDAAIAPLQTAVVAALLGAVATTIQAELTALPPSVAGWHPAQGEWCIKETLGHMIEAERRGFAGRIKIILDSVDPVLSGWDPAAVARERRDCERDLSMLLDEFSTQRAASSNLVAGLHEADLRHGGHHPDIGYVVVEELLHEWVHHDRNHLRQMLANVQAYTWPHMGATQRFSQPIRKTLPS